MTVRDVIPLANPQSAAAPDAPALSVVIPVYNEEPGLAALFERLYPALDALAVPYEVVFINDGSRDRSAALLAEQFERRPDVTRVILFNGNFGQHRAILAGFEHCRGERIVTLDADLQNPPEDIRLLLDEMDRGHDCVGSIRRDRHDSAWRRWASRAMNRLRRRLTGIAMTDQGCMMRAYSRNVVQLINQCNEMNTFIPALAYQFAKNPTEVVVGHEARHAGESKYSLYSLIRLNFDLVTGFSRGAAAGVLDARHRRLAAVGAAVPGAGRTPHRARPGGRRRVHAVRAAVPADGAGAVRHRAARRIRRAHLPGGPVAAALRHQRDPGAQAMTDARPAARAIVFAYHDVGVRCLRVLLDAGVQVPLVVTHRDDPGEQVWFASVAAWPPSIGCVA